MCLPLCRGSVWGRLARPVGCWRGSTSWDWRSRWSECSGCRPWPVFEILLCLKTNKIEYRSSMLQPKGSWEGTRENIISKVCVTKFWKTQTMLLQHYCDHKTSVTSVNCMLVCMYEQKYAHLTLTPMTFVPKLVQAIMHLQAGNRGINKSQPEQMQKDNCNSTPGWWNHSFGSSIPGLGNAFQLNVWEFISSPFHWMYRTFTNHKLVITIAGVSRPHRARLKQIKSLKSLKFKVMSR